MYWIARDLVNRGWPHRSIVYLDFEDVRLMGIRPSDFDSFIKVINEETKAWNGRVVLLLDEVQNIPEWSRWVKTLLNRGRHLVVVSGSSSRLRLVKSPRSLGVGTLRGWFYPSPLGSSLGLGFSNRLPKGA
jgi:hypothetical protein